MEKSLHLIVGAVVASGLTSIASSDIVAPAFHFSLSTVGNTGVTQDAANFGSVIHTNPTEWLYHGSMSQSDMGSLSWAYLVDPDPYITGTVSLTNTTATSQSYVLDFTLNITPALIDGSYIAGQANGTITDANGNGSATVASSGSTPIYSALGDGAFIQGLMSNASQSVSNPFGTASFSGGSFGYPINTLMGPAINSTIGIRFAFSLTAGDSVSFSSIFIANPVPAPGALTLMVGAGLAGFGRRRR